MLRSEWEAAVRTILNSNHHANMAEALRVFEATGDGLEALKAGETVLRDA